MTSLFSSDFQDDKDRDTTTKMQRYSLLLVSSGLPSASGLLDLAALASGEGLGVRVRGASSSEVLNSLTSLPGALEKQSVLASRSSESQLIKSDNLASSLQNPLTGLLGDAESAKSHLGNLEDPQVVGDGSDDDGDLVSVASLLHVPDQPSDGEGRAVDLAHEEPPQDDLVELGLGPPGQEPVELDEEPQVDILALGFSSANLAVILMVDINTHVFSCRSESSNI